MDNNSTTVTTVTNKTRNPYVWAFVATLLLLILSLVGFGTYIYSQNRNQDTEVKSLKEEIENLKKATPTPTSSPTSSATATPTVQIVWKTYKYDYLDISFEYPSSWTVSEATNNPKGSGYEFSCIEPNVVNEYLRNTSLCANNNVSPRNLVIQGPNGEIITLWNASGLGGCCEDQSKLFKTFEMYNSSVKVPTYSDNPFSTYGDKKDAFSTFIGIDIKTGSKSAWKKYILSLQSPKESSDIIDHILKSFKTNS